MQMVSLGERRQEGGVSRLEFGQEGLDVETGPELEASLEMSIEGMGHNHTVHRQAMVDERVKLVSRLFRIMTDGNNGLLLIRSVLSEEITPGGGDDRYPGGAHQRDFVNHDLPRDLKALSEIFPSNSVMVRAESGQDQLLSFMPVQTNHLPYRMAQSARIGNGSGIKRHPPSVGPLIG